MGKQNLIRLAKKYGTEEFTIGNIGCVSVKVDDYIYIKSQDTSLTALSYKKIAEFSIDDLNEVTDNFVDPIEYDGIASQEKIGNITIKGTKVEPTNLLQRLNELRIDDNLLDLQAEALIHNSLGYDYCLYLEPAFANAVCCAKQGKKWVNDTFHCLALWMPYKVASSEYAKNVIEKIKEHEAKYNCCPQIIFFQNRGVLLSADSETALYELFDIFSEILYKDFNILFDDQPYAQSQKQAQHAMDRIAQLYVGSTASVYYPKGIECTFCGIYGVKMALKDKSALVRFARPFTESHAICYEKPILFAEFDKIYLEKEFNRYVYKNNFAPQIIAVKNLGFFVIDESLKRAELIKNLFIDQIKVGVLAENFGGGRFIPKEKPITEEETTEEEPTQTETKSA